VIVLVTDKRAARAVVMIVREGTSDKKKGKPGIGLPF
jgi:hypothetical protein